MASGRILHSGNLVRGVFVGDEDTFRKRFYDSKRTMEIGTTFVRDDGAVFVVLNDNKWISRNSEGAFSRAKTSSKGTRENWRQKETRGDL